jgi:hypothetical protein
MKNNKYIYIVIALSSLLTISVYFNLQSESSNSKNVAVSKQGPSFEQKQKCAAYKKDYEVKFEINNNDEMSTEYYYLEKVFYSPILNSCLVQYNSAFGFGKGRYKTLYLDDALTGGRISNSMVVIEGKPELNSEKEFNELVKRYE